MALLKQHSPKPGVSGNYWRIEQIEYKQKEKYAVVLLALYPDSATTEGVDPLYYKEYIWQGDVEFPFSVDAMNSNGENPTMIAYNKIKAEDPDLADSEVV